MSINNNHKNVFELQGVSKIYEMGDEKIRALDNVDLIIKQGEFTSVVGPSGSGKSTLMHVIGFMDKPTKGKVLLNGEDISHLPENKLAQVRRYNVGFIFQSFNLMPRLSVYQNILLPLNYHKIKNSEAKKRTLNAINLVGLDKWQNHKPSQLSGGQRQRVAIARAMVINPQYILADEPTGNLDSNTAKIIMAMLVDLNKNGTTIIIVTHDLDIARQTPRAITIKDGKISEGSMFSNFK